MAKRLLILEDGTIFEGKAFGADLDVTGEIVFNTGMTGYQESITDQSYNGQILTFTYPLVGNYGINRDDYESITPTCKGVVVSENARRANNWRNQMTLDEFLKAKNIPGISGIDTRALTKIIRKHGTMKATLANAGDTIEHLQDQLRATVLPTNNIEQVSTKTAYPAPGVGKNIVLVDFGLKHSILDMIRGVQGKIPIFGICMGHQLFSLANGAKTYKMKFGHRGFNHAVREIATGRIDFTSQNHGYAVDRDTLPDCLMVTHEEINDKSVEGIRHRDFPAFSVQFHPDAAPGPHDASYLFDDFIELIDAFQAEKANR